MIKIKQAPPEKVNKHITHLEDLFVERGVTGGTIAIDIVNEIVDNFDDLSNSSVHVSTKVDGAPAIVFGTNPENGTRFVASKSIFNKVPKINYSLNDVDINHPTSTVNPILKQVLTYTRNSDFGGGIYQGDLLYFPSMLEERIIGCTNNYVFKPNTLMYGVPTKSALGTAIKNSKIGIGVHTKYIGDTIASLEASYSFDINDISYNKDVVLMHGYMYNVYDIRFGSQELYQIKINLIEIEQKMNSIEYMLNTLGERDSQRVMLRQYINNEVRSNSIDLDLDFDRFVAFIKYKFKDKKSKRSVDRLADIVAAVQKDKDAFNKVFDIHSKFYEIKKILLYGFDRFVHMATYLEEKDGTITPTNPEGYVAVDRGGNVVKLVDRLVFSRINFKR